MSLALKPAPDQPLIFFFNDTATTEIYTLSLHDALPISVLDDSPLRVDGDDVPRVLDLQALVSHGSAPTSGDRKSTRLNSSHSQISYAAFCLIKKKRPRSSSRSVFLEASRTIRSTYHPAT